MPNVLEIHKQKKKKFHVKNISLGDKMFLLKPQPERIETEVTIQSKIIEKFSTRGLSTHFTNS